MKIASVLVPATFGVVLAFGLAPAPVHAAEAACIGSHCVVAHRHYVHHYAHSYSHRHYDAGHDRY
jgi:hypothetical protein